MTCVKCLSVIKEHENCNYCWENFHIQRHTNCCDGSIPNELEKKRQLAIDKEKNDNSKSTRSQS